MSDWIGVDDRKPPEWEYVLICGRYSVRNPHQVVVGTYATDRYDLWTDSEGNGIEATHWMPLPSPPEVR